MVIDTNIIITAIVFLIIVWIISWIISSHRFKTLIFIGLYLAAISPSLAALLSSFTFDKLIMVWFDSVLIYILFSIYLCALIVMLMFERGWLQKKWKWGTKASADFKSPSKETINLVNTTVERDLKKAAITMEASEIKEIKRRDEQLMKKYGVPPTLILEEHNKCLTKAENANINKGKNYFGCRIQEEQ